MAHKVAAAFFAAPEVLFVGYSRKSLAFCASVRKAFEERGQAVYPVNPSAGEFDVKVYASIEEAPGKPELAYVLTKAANNRGLATKLAAKGIKRVAFGSSLNADAAVLEECKKAGLDARLACPLMAMGKGLHRFHGWLAGVEAFPAKA